MDVSNLGSVGASYKSQIVKELMKESIINSEKIAYELRWVNGFNTLPSPTPTQQHFSLSYQTLSRQDR